MLSQNPEIVQPEDWAHPNKSAFQTPVFMIHDGGGTTFAYHCLQPMYRYVYGISNPSYRTPQNFEDGLPQMARLYASWIKEMVGKSNFPVKRKNRDGSINIMLGGWSLGGLLSLEVARQLAEDRKVRVVGILFIDSVFPGLLRSPSPGSSPTSIKSMTVSAEEAMENSSAHAGKSKSQLAAIRCMGDATRMVRDWRVPEWTGRLLDKRPRCILIRASERIPVSKGTAGLDLRRDDEALGWDEYDFELFDDIINVDGHHFNMFAADKIDGISRAVKNGLDKLDQLGQMMMLDFV